MLLADGNGRSSGHHRNASNDGCVGAGECERLHHLKRHNYSFDPSTEAPAVVKHYKQGSTTTTNTTTSNKSYKTTSLQIATKSQLYDDDDDDSEELELGAGEKSQGGEANKRHGQGEITLKLELAATTITTPAPVNFFKVAFVGAFGRIMSFLGQTKNDSGESSYHRGNNRLLFVDSPTTAFNVETGNASKRKKSPSPSLSALVPRRLRRIFSGYHGNVGQPCDCLPTQSRFLVLCVSVYIINVLLFLAAIATYVKFSRYHETLATIVERQEIVFKQPQTSVTDEAARRKKLLARSFAPGKLPFWYNQSGYVLYGGSDYFKFRSRVSTSLVYRVPLTDRVKRMFYDEGNTNRLAALAPAISLTADNQVQMFQRLWMSQNEKHHLKRTAPVNTLAENYVVKFRMTHEYEEIEHPKLVPIPATTNCVKQFNYRTDGPMDARSFVINGTNFLSFHLWHVDPEFMLPRSRLFLWNEETGQLSKMKIANYTMLWTEINWVPLVINGSLYFTYSFDPLRVVHCPDITSHPIIWCNMIFQGSESPKYNFNEWIDAFRGGSPWVHYQGPYFVSFAHTHYQYVKEFITNETFVEGGIYAGNLAVLKVSPPLPGETVVSGFRLIYLSEPLLFNRKLLLSGDITRSQIINWPFAFPVGMILWNGDVADVGVHINDSRGYVIRFTGLLNLLRKVFEFDRRHTTSLSVEDGDVGQPDIGLVHKLARESVKAMRDSEVSEDFP